jgi:hypothetical protein
VPPRIEHAIVASTIALAMLTVPGRSFGADPTPDPTPARVRVEAPTDCASPSSFWSAVERHTDRLRPGTDDRAATIDVTVRRSNGGVVGDLRVARAGEAPWQRRLSGATCTEVMDGLGLVAALAFDPAAKADATPRAPAPIATTEPAPASAASAPPVSKSPSAPPETRAPATPREEPARTIESTGGWRGGLGGLVGPLALGAGATLGYGAFVDVEHDRAGLAPSLRLGVVHVEGYAGESAARAALAWTVGRASVCPLRAQLGTSLHLRPCVGLDAGVVLASARGVDRPRDTSRPWVAPVLAGRVMWSPAGS